MKKNQLSKLHLSSAIELTKRQMRLIRGGDGDVGYILPPISCGTDGTQPCYCLDSEKGPFCAFSQNECYYFCGQ